MRQIYPSTITGKDFAEGGSVLDHRFGSSDPYTLGVEEEYMLLDGQTLDLVQHIETMLDAVSGHELEERINPELMQSVIEITTPICRLDDIPVGSPRQNGDDADSASRPGRCTSSPFTTWTAFSGSSTATCTCIPKMSSRRAMYCIWSMSAR